MQNKLQNLQGRSVRIRGRAFADTRYLDLADADAELLRVAKAKRSELRNLRPLRELAMVKLVSRDGTGVGDKPAAVVPASCVDPKCPRKPGQQERNRAMTFHDPAPRRYRHFCTSLVEPLSIDDGGKMILPQVPLILQKEIQNHIMTLLDSSQHYNFRTWDMTNWMLILFEQLLLNERTKEFDFGIISNDPKYDQQIWMMLVEKCPNLERITDTRSFYSVGLVQIGTVLPYLKSFKKLEHILLKTYICSSNDLTEISKHFPNLRTLSAEIEYLSADFLKSLFTLQRLERLNIVWKKLLFYGKCSEERNYPKEREHCFNHFNAECLAHLPHLQYLSGGAENHNNRPIAGNRQLSLREMVVDGVFDFNLVPCLEKLTISRSDHLDFGFLSNLRSLNFNGGVASERIYDVLSACGDKLEELTILDYGELYLDLYKLLSKCLKLREFSADCYFLSYEDSTCSLTADHFKFMKKFYADHNHSDNISSGTELMSLILTAPNIEFIYMSADCLCSSADLQIFTRQLVEGRILQKLKMLELGCKMITEQSLTLYF